MNKQYQSDLCNCDFSLTIVSTCASILLLSIEALSLKWKQNDLNINIDQN